MSKLPSWQYHAYLTLYILIFMLDDLFVFFVAMKTLQVTGLTGTYVRHAHAVGGMVLIGIGLLLLLKPEWLTFAG
jgi:cadmium resistance protein CadD (predicted permease)